MKNLSLAAAVVALSMAGAITLWSATQPMGAINVPVGMALQLKVGGKAVAVPTGRDVPIVAAKYQPAQLTCAATQPNPAGAPILWTISAIGPTWGKIKDIAVTEGQTTTLEAGPPFTLKTVVYQSKTDQGVKVIPFTVHVFGKAGEIYDLNTFKKGAAQAPQLALQVVDEAGKVLATGTLPYG